MDQPSQLPAASIDLEPSPSPIHAGIRAFPERFDIEDSDEERFSATGSAINASSNTTASGPTSRYPNMGLNRRRPRSTGHIPDSRRRNTTKSTGPRKTESVREICNSETVDEEEDLAELKALMVPEEMRSSPRQPAASSTAGFLTESGWHTINNPALANTFSEETSTDHPLAAHRSDIPEKEDSVIGSSSNPVDKEKPGEELDDVADMLDKKYFKHNGYLNYINNVEDSDESDSSKERKKAKVQTKLKATKKKGLQVISGTPPSRSAIAGKSLRSPRETTKTPAQPPATKDTPKIDYEAERDSSPSSSSDEAGKWELLEGNIDAPRTGNKSVHKLTIKLRDIATGETKTLTYADVPHDAIDWKSKPQVVAITQWRTDVFRNHGINTKKNMYTYTPLEDAWMTFFHSKLRATIEAGHVVRLPGPVSVMEAFNAFFDGKVLNDANGDDVPSRPARDVTSIRGKLDGKVSKIAIERKYMRGLVEGKTGGVLFVPVITEDELKKFQEDGSVVVDDPTEVDKNMALDSDGKKSGKSSPKKKRDEKDAGEGVAKKTK